MRVPALLQREAKALLRNDKPTLGLVSVKDLQRRNVFVTDEGEERVSFIVIGRKVLLTDGTEVRVADAKPKFFIRVAGRRELELYLKDSECVRIEHAVNCPKDGSCSRHKGDFDSHCPQWLYDFKMRAFRDLYFTTYDEAVEYGDGLGLPYEIERSGKDQTYNVVSPGGRESGAMTYNQFLRRYSRALTVIVDVALL